MLLRSAGDTDDTVAHLGPGYPVSLDGLSATIGNRIWERVSWQTPARRGSGWLPVSALDTTRPKLVPSAGIDALDASLAAYLSKIGSRVGVQVRDITRGTVYGYNADRSYITASSRKVQIMLAFLDKCELAHREPTSSEMALLTKMIEHSDNAAADALYDAIGGGPGMSAYMRKIGVTGLVPSDPGSGIEWSTITPASMVHVLYLLQTGAVLTPEHRALALNLMGHVQTDQRLGVADTAPAGATVAMKVGWVVGPDGLWLVNSSGILTLRGETYAIAVFTEKGRSFEDGRGIVRHVCAAIAADLT